MKQHGLCGNKRNKLPQKKRLWEIHVGNGQQIKDPSHLWQHQSEQHQRKQTHMLECLLWKNYVPRALRGVMLPKLGSQRDRLQGEWLRAPKEETDMCDHHHSECVWLATAATSLPQITNLTPSEYDWMSRRPILQAQSPLGGWVGATNSVQKVKDASFPESRVPSPAPSTSTSLSQKH